MFLLLFPTEKKHVLLRLGLATFNKLFLFSFSCFDFQFCNFLVSWCGWKKIIFKKELHHKNFATSENLMRRAKFNARTRLLQSIPNLTCEILSVYPPLACFITPFLFFHGFSYSFSFSIIGFLYWDTAGERIIIAIIVRVFVCCCGWVSDCRLSLAIFQLDFLNKLQFNIQQNYTEWCDDWMFDESCCWFSQGRAFVRWINRLW